jgi:hypothetical protein
MLSGRGATENMEGRCAFLFLLARIITNRRQMKTVISERVPVEAQKLLHCSCEKTASLLHVVKCATDRVPRIVGSVSFGLKRESFNSF